MSGIRTSQPWPTPSVRPNRWASTGNRLPAGACSWRWGGCSASSIRQRRPRPSALRWRETVEPNPRSRRRSPSSPSCAVGAAASAAPPAEASGAGGDGRGRSDPRARSFPPRRSGPATCRPYAEPPPRPRPPPSPASRAPGPMNQQPTHRPRQLRVGMKLLPRELSPDCEVVGQRHSQGTRRYQQSTRSPTPVPLAATRNQRWLTARPASTVAVAALPSAPRPRKAVTSRRAAPCFVSRFIRMLLASARSTRLVRHRTLPDTRRTFER